MERVCFRYHSRRNHLYYPDTVAFVYTRMIPLDDYRKHPAVNVSTLKNLTNPRWVKWKLDNPDAEDEEKSHFRVGGALDTILTNKNKFNDLYVVETMRRPGGLMGLFIDNLPLDLTENSPDDAYLEAYDKSGYRIPLSLVKKRLWESHQFTSYFMARKRAHGKSIITVDENEEVNYCNEQIINNAYTRPYFQNTDPNIRLIHQAVILFDYNGVACKGALDGLKIDFKNKKIYPFDLKTTARKVTSFGSVFLMNGYYLQGAFYVEGLKRVFEQNPDKFISYFNLPREVLSYDIEYMRFIVVEKKRSLFGLPPHIFRTTEELHNLGIKGGKIHNRTYKGFESYLDDWAEHHRTNFWEYSQDYMKSNGEFDIEVE